METFKGSCLCGGVNYQVKFSPKQFYFCHCEQCRKVTGSAFAPNIVGEKSEITWTKGADLVKRYDDPERSFTKVFCSRCGSSLPFTNKSDTHTIVPAGSLDHEPKILPGHNIFAAEQPKWSANGASAKCCDEYPPSS